MNVNTTMIDMMANVTITNDYEYTQMNKSPYTLPALQSVQIAVCILNSFFISYGLFLLITIKQRRTLTNNMVAYTNVSLLMMLSGSGLSTSVLFIITQAGWFFKLEFVHKIGKLLVWVIGSLYVSTVYMITTNRLMCTIYPIWYATSMTKTTFYAVVLLVGTALTGFKSSGGFILHLTKENNRSKINAVVQVISYGSYLIFSIFTYITIFCTILKSRRISRPNAIEETNEKKLLFIWKKIKKEGYVIPFVITLTYTLFVMFPGTVWIVFIFMNEVAYADVAYRVWILTFYINMFSDTCIYTFCDRDIGNYVKGKLRKNCVNGGRLQVTDLRNEGNNNVQTITTEV